ncbi:MAG: helix-hairpin-helix domain-containing protein [Chryseolinea sp.]
MIILIFSEPVWRWWITNRTEDYSQDRQKLDSLIALWDVQDSIPKGSYERIMRPKFFSFNPNKASVDDLITLGFSKSASNRMIHYREKGGAFKVKSDVLKIYGVDTTHYQQLYSFIALPEKLEFRPALELKSKSFAKKSIEKFNLNLADTAQLKKIYGIGEKLSFRILKYRDALGGFIAMDQLKEVYGLDSTIVNRLEKQSFVESGFNPSKININTIGEKELAIHPYISNKEAKAIVAYRFQHGEFKALADIGNILGVEAETIRKIAPYLKFND